MTPKTDTATFVYRIAELNLRLTFAKSKIKFCYTVNES